MEFSRQEYWSALLCPPPGDLTDPLAGRFFTTSATREALFVIRELQFKRMKK